MQVLIDQGVIPKLIRLLHSDDPGLRLNAFWAFKNLLFNTTMEVKQQVIAGIGWDELASYVPSNLWILSLLNDIQMHEYGLGSWHPRASLSHGATHSRC